MYESSQGAVAVFDFEEIANHLVEQGSHVSPAEIHGCLSGLLSSGAGQEGELGLDRLCQALDLVAHGELADQIMQLYRATAAALADEEFGFHPLLPADDEDIDLRTAALANWCRGFLAGFALMRADPVNSAREWSSDAREILEDFAALAQATVGENETADESEGSYMEIVEYLRFAVLNLFMEQHALSDGDTLNRGPRDSLH